VSPIKYQNLEEVIIKIQDENKTPLIIILDGVTDVRNFGAIARSCECAGASAIVIPTSGSVRISGMKQLKPLLEHCIIFQFAKLKI